MDVNKTIRRNKSWTIHHAIVFVLTFFGYAFFHATRKTFSNVKETISSIWTPTFHNGSSEQIQPDYLWNRPTLFDSQNKAEDFLGVLDTVFLFAYAVGLFISGAVGDRFDLRKVLTFGMCSSAICVFMFGTLSEWLHVYSVWYYVPFWVLNGLLQSTGWPAMVAVMGHWFGQHSRGLVLGLWSACASVGNIMGALLTSAVLKYGYEYAFLITSAILFAWGVVIFFALVPKPTDIGIAEPEEDGAKSDLSINPDRHADSAATPLLDDDCDIGQRPERSGAISFCSALRLPGVILYSLSYACLKFVNYAFFFWLPLYLSSAFHWSAIVADEISIWYDVGGIVGGTIAGVISDRMRKRTITVVVMMAFAAPSLWIYSIASNSLLSNALRMAVVGFFIGGPAGLISAAISADLGRQGPIQGNTEALATVTGIVDGTGSFGAAIGQILVPVIHQSFGWHWVFNFFIIMTLLSVGCLLPIFIHDVTSYCKRPRCTPASLPNDDDDQVEEEGEGAERPLLVH